MHLPASYLDWVQLKAQLTSQNKSLLYKTITDCDWPMLDTLQRNCGKMQTAASIKTKRGQCAWLCYVARHHSSPKVARCDQNMVAVVATKHLQMSLFSCRMRLCLTLSRCRHLGSAERNQGVIKSQLVLYIYVHACMYVHVCMYICIYIFSM